MAANLFILICGAASIDAALAKVWKKNGSMPDDYAVQFIVSLQRKGYSVYDKHEICQSSKPIHSWIRGEDPDTCKGDD
ncbi:MAG: hypothetical protein ACLR6B_03690 [Blautia sp.]